LALVGKAMPVASRPWVQRLVAKGFVAVAPRLLDVSEPEKVLQLLNERRDRAHEMT
jgi:hypothetical protein